MFRPQNKFISVLTGAMVVFFFQSAHADLASTIKISELVTMQFKTMDSIGTGSTGSYSYGEKKGEGSKTKSYAHGKNHHGSKKNHGYSHNRSEGSKTKSYAHGKNHHGSKKNRGYSHNRSEGSKTKSYAHGKSHHGSKKNHGYSHNRSEGSKTKSYAYEKSHHNHKKASNHGGHRNYGSSPFKHVMHYKYKLGLTDAQITKMKQLDVGFIKKIIQAKADHEKAHLELDLQVHSGEVDEAKIRGAGAKIVASKTDKIMAMIEAKIQLLKLLTTEQRQKMAKMH